jgi:succinoglycan biosynthesis transport protein ExoP
LWIVVLIPIFTVSAIVGVSLLQQPVYDASATVVVSPKGGTQDNFSNTISGLQALAIEMEATGLNRSMVEEIVNTVESSMVSAADINNNLTIAQLEDTRFLTLTYSDTFKRRAQEVVNVTVKTFAEKAHEASGVAANADINANALAGVPTTPEDPDPLRNGFGALLIELMLGIGLAFLLEYL